MPKGRIVLLASLGFVTGISILSFIGYISELWFFVGFLISLVLVFISQYYKKLLLTYIIVSLSGFFLAGWRYSLSYPVINSSHISYYNGQKKTFSGLVSKEPVRKDKGWQLTVKTDYGKVLVTTDNFPEYHYGDLLKITSLLEAPESVDFPYDRYLARYGIYSVCYRPLITFIQGGQGFGWYNWIITVKQQAYKIAQTYVPEPEASLALPVVFGGGSEIDEDITEQFRRTGLTHIMAVSGFNVSLLTALLGWGLYSFGLKRKLVFYVTSFLISGYVVMVGAPASATRAGVMSILLLGAITVGRLVSLPRSLLLVAVLTLLVNPRLLRDDIGWQLSFLALLGLIYIHPLLQRLGMKLSHGKGKWLIEGLAATISAQIATAPVIFYNFGNFSVIAPIANLLVVWVVPILTIAMMVALALTAIFPSLGLICFLPCWLMVKYIFWVVQVLSGLSWAAVEV